MPEDKKENEMEALEEEMWEEAELLKDVRTGDILLIPMRVKKKRPDAIELRPLHPELRTATAQSGTGALFLLFHARETCSTCARYRAFRDIPDEGHCDCEGRVLAWRESCINYRIR